LPSASINLGALSGNMSLPQVERENEAASTAKIVRPFILNDVRACTFVHRDINICGVVTPFRSIAVKTGGKPEDAS
jgi:hypothetical protein